MRPGASRASSRIINATRFLFDVPADRILDIGLTNALPVFEEEVLAELCEEAKEMFHNTPMLVELDEDAYIIGDLHGSLHDLFRILKETDCMNNRLVFLGDYVDRGNFSTEVISLLFALAIEYPDHFTLIRGNHEFRDVCDKYGFRNEVIEIYESDFLWGKFVEAFEYMPIACILSGKHLCVHGGISQHLTSMDQIRNLRRPLRDCGQAKFVMDLLWADPSETISKYSQSARGEDYSQFGSSAFKKFLIDMGLKSVVRAHQFIEEGLKRQFNSLLTVFSASSYQFDGSNKCGVLMYKRDEDLFRSKVFDPFPRLDRSQLMFVNVRLVRKVSVDEPVKLPKLLCLELRSQSGKGVVTRPRMMSATAKNVRASDGAGRPLATYRPMTTETRVSGPRKPNIRSCASSHLRATYRTCAAPYSVFQCHNND